VKRFAIGVVLAALFGAFFWQAGAIAQTSESATQPDGQISAQRDPKSDAALQGRLNQLFDEVDGLSRVWAQVRDGVVRLSGTVAEPALARAAESLASRVEGVVLVENRIEIDTDIANRFEPLMKRAKADLQNVLLFLPLFFVGVVVVILFWVFAQLVIWLAGPLLKRTPNEFIQNIVKTAIRAVFIGVGILMALEAMDATELATSILGAAGLVGLAVGFAVKDTIENYLASIMLSVRQPFSPHEVVNIDGQEGMVARLTSRSTVLINFEGNHVRIPNATVFKATIINYSREPKRRFDFKIGIDPAADIDTARGLILKTLEDFGAILNDPKPLAVINELGDWAVILWIAAWIDQRDTDLTKAKSESLRLIKAALDAAGIGMPNPTYTIVTSEGAAKPEAAKPVERPPVGAVEVTPDTSVERVMDDAVDRDREKAEAPDLLKEDAAKE
jgi:small-conductance mechanosensitive channel